MSTYNSKFSGAEIDTLLEKTKELSDLHAAGQLGGGGGGGSEKEPVLKELGATHKHLCKLSASPDEGFTMAVWLYLYNNSANAYTADEAVNYLTNCWTMQNGYMAQAMNGKLMASGDVKIGKIKFDESTTTIGIVAPLECSLNNVVSSVDFSNQTATSETMPFIRYEALPLDEMISMDGFTFTDTVTEL